MESFTKLKNLLTCSPVLQIYDLWKEVTISVDASSKGLGTVLLQMNNLLHTHHEPLLKQNRYAQIEREMLAVFDGCENFISS